MMLPSNAFIEIQIKCDISHLEPNLPPNRGEDVILDGTSRPVSQTEVAKLSTVPYQDIRVVSVTTNCTSDSPTVVPSQS
jgi:hypothetical protein